MREMARNSLACMACLVATSAFAQGAGDHHFYVGADAGWSNLHDSGDFDVQQGVDDDQSITFSVRLGYRFNRYFSLEAGYTDLGEFDATPSVACPAIYPPGSCAAFDASTSIDGVTLGAVGTWPVSRHFQLEASAVAIYREVEYSYGGASGLGSLSEEGTAWKLGLGVGVPINDRFELGLELAQYRDVGIRIGAGANGVDTSNDGYATVITLGARLFF
jgi:OmpA-OmpF porin, OOP family